MLALWLLMVQMVGSQEADNVLPSPGITTTETVMSTGSLHTSPHHSTTVIAAGTSGLTLATSSSVDAVITTSSRSEFDDGGKWDDVKKSNASNKESLPWKSSLQEEPKDKSREKNISHITNRERNATTNKHPQGVAFQGYGPEAATSGRSSSVSIHPGPARLAGFGVNRFNLHTRPSDDEYGTPVEPEQNYVNKGDRRRLEEEPDKDVSDRETHSAEGVVNSERYASMQHTGREATYNRYSDNIVDEGRHKANYGEQNHHESENDNRASQHVTHVTHEPQSSFHSNWYKVKVKKIISRTHRLKVNKKDGGKYTDDLNGEYGHRILNDYPHAPTPPDNGLVMVATDPTMVAKSRRRRIWSSLLVRSLPGQHATSAPPLGTWLPQPILNATSTEATMHTTTPPSVTNDDLYASPVPAPRTIGNIDPPGANGTDGDARGVKMSTIKRWTLIRQLTQSKFSWVDIIITVSCSVAILLVLINMGVFFQYCIHRRKLNSNYRPPRAPPAASTFCVRMDTLCKAHNHAALNANLGQRICRKLQLASPRVGGHFRQQVDDGSLAKTSVGTQYESTEAMIASFINNDLIGELNDRDSTCTSVSEGFTFSRDYGMPQGFQECGTEL